ncbi:uncharacterized protein LTHEOB_104 [Lasiodiplodia theobromae]|uniref:uncharacterized protein n=1 Tax=Lasiodiplodia theobromae TaxID=45133 RepID=UPI0015C30647|nr:uncharacterized protein LTHEOB_104 [Lasiodiplodia theobromae]KAF4543405.1 hypothetical protein LTHEOB_104 [Lasiodiplodia theobromae]
MTDFVLERPIDVTAKDYLGHSALTYAAWDDQENVEFMRLLIPRMSLPQLEEVYRDEKSILHYICERNKVGIQDLIKDYLLQQIAECEKKCSRGRIPLMYAPAIITDDAIASSLIHFSGKTMKICDNDGQDLMYWSSHGDEQGLQWLLDEGMVSDASAETQNGSSPLILAAFFGHPRMCKKLIELGNPISKANHDGCTALHLACQDGYLEICKLLIATDNSCVFQNLGKQTPLEIAAGNGNIKIVELLLENDAQVTVGAEISARKAGSHDIAELLRCKLSTGNETSTGNTIAELYSVRLKAACEDSSESTLMEVLQKDINPNIRLSYKYRTPLHFACREGWKEAVELLVEKNANIEALDEEGCSPLMVAVKLGNLECAELLSQKGAQITTRDKCGYTTLHWAAGQNHFAILSYLLEEGIKANVQTYHGLWHGDFAPSRMQQNS